MSHLTNPLATVGQLYQRDTLPEELQTSILYYTARLTQAAGILLRLPQDITAQANVLLFRYFLVDDIMAREFSDISAATLYLTAKISSSPRSLRSITNVYAYLLSPSSPLNTGPVANNPDTYYLSEASYIIFRNRLLNIEGQVLNALGFNTHVTLPYPLAITYLQTLGVFAGDSKEKGSKFAKRTIEYLNTALLSPQMLYLTHQPASLATAAIYLAAKEEGAKMPEVEWWEVFDCEREELGFLVVALGSFRALVEREEKRWEGRGMVTRRDVRDVMAKSNGNGQEEEETRMGRLLDEKIAA
ncbi:cyclin-like protein [Calycina marina]|uniref:Cyclin-like protein n=1 Tax=Calycina marina TaxID=1763456 RepID=A0A9P8CBE3_9HELO|nr:cyclin-like protein [Calycina marina]